MANLTGFDANNVQPAASRELIPAGKYAAVIVASELKSTKSGSGQYLELTFEIAEGASKSRRLWARLNLVNSNAMAVQIAQAELSAICRAAGIMTPRDSADLHNIPMLIGVIVKNRSDTGQLANEIQSYEKASAASQPIQPTASPFAPPPGPAPGSGTMPWRR